MPFLRCTEERGHVVRIAEIRDRYVDVYSSNLLMVSLDFVAFDKPFDHYMYIVILITG